MTTEIINLTGTIGHWLNLLVARQIAAQAAKTASLGRELSETTGTGASEAASSPGN